MKMILATVAFVIGAVVSLVLVLMRTGKDTKAAKEKVMKFEEDWQQKLKEVDFNKKVDVIREEAVQKTVDEVMKKWEKRFGVTK